jgi:hypothetical protein
MNESMCYPKILFFSKIDSTQPQPETESMKMSNQEILAYWNSNFANFQDTDCQILGQLDQEMQEGESKRLINAPEFYQSNESQDEISTTYSSTASNAAEEKQALPEDPLQ